MSSAPCLLPSVSFLQQNGAHANLRNRRETCDRCLGVAAPRGSPCNIRVRLLSVFTHAVAPPLSVFWPPHVHAHAPLRCPRPRRRSPSSVTDSPAARPRCICPSLTACPSLSPVLLFAAEHAPSLYQLHSRVIYSTNARVPSVPPRRVPLRARNIPTPRARLRPWLPGARRPTARGR